MIYEAVGVSLNALEMAAKNRRETRVWREARASQAHAREVMTRNLLAAIRMDEQQLYYQIMAQAALRRLRYFRNMQETRLESYRLYWAKAEAQLKAYREYQRVVQEGIERYRAWKRMVERELIKYRVEQRTEEKKTQAYRLSLKREAEAFLQYTRGQAALDRKIKQSEISYAGRKTYSQVWGGSNKDDSSKGVSSLQTKA